MRQPSCLRTIGAACLGFFCFCTGAVTWLGTAHADQVEMVNGDRYVGRVLSLGSETLVIQNEYLGTLKLPRARIATIALDANPLRSGTNVTNAAKASSMVVRSNRLAQIARNSTTNSAPGFASAISELGTNSSVLQQVQQQLLAGAGPEAQAKFNDLVSGLMSGKLGVNELRVEARNTLEQARNARKELGDEGSSMDGYLAILEGFLKESEPTSRATNSTAVLPSSAPPARPGVDQ